MNQSKKNQNARKMRGAAFASGHQAFTRGVLNDPRVRVESKGKSFYNENNFIALCFVASIPKYFKSRGKVQKWTRQDVIEVNKLARKILPNKNRIVIASTPAWVDERYMNLLDGGILHECAHSLYTEIGANVDVDRMLDVLTKHYDPEVNLEDKMDLLKKLWNIFEDAYIERKLQERFRGALKKLQYVHEYVWELERPRRVLPIGSVGQDDKGNPIPAFEPIDHFSCYLRDRIEHYLSGAPLNQYDPKVRSVLDSLFVEEVADSDLTEDSYDTLALALRTLNKLNDVMDTAEQQGKGGQQQQQNQKGQQGQQSSQSSQGQEGQEGQEGDSSDGSQQSSGNSGSSSKSNSTPQWDEYQEEGEGSQSDSEGDEDGQQGEDTGDGSDGSQEGDTDDSEESAGDGADSDGEDQDGEDSEGSSSGEGSEDGEEDSDTEGDGGEGDDDSSEDGEDSKNGQGANSDDSEGDDTEEGSDDAKEGDTDDSEAGGSEPQNGRGKKPQWDQDVLDALSKAREAKNILDNRDAMQDAYDDATSDGAPPTVHPYSREQDEIVEIKAEMSDRETRIYTEMMDRCREATVALRPRMLSFFRGQKETRRVHRQAKGRRLGRTVSEVVYRDKPRPFQTKTTRKLRDSVVSLVLDESGSMDAYEEHARMILASLALTIGELRIPHEVIGFTTSRYNAVQLDPNDDWYDVQNTFTRINPLRFRIFRKFDEPFNVNSYRKLTHTDASALTPLPDAIEFAGSRLVTRKEDQKIMFVVTDGQPYYGEMNWTTQDYLNMMQTQVDQFKKMGVEVLFVGVGYSAGYVEQFENSIFLGDSNNFTAKFNGFLMEQMRRLLVE
jgi:cobalamin biosynthesis protein CobT